ncbi:putative Ni,Fe-hydrogenase I cytochrome b subunit [Arcticibacter svalbardensis MN12-7]|uniref:Putative Ni,Fe-hydrogenase I cytochrome b subunit n=1 Tax=Arcticibacter svalbardensis MN12-7 TaxID=1150600 RepID=R9GQD3_9SPHI|nr:cytochrome b/b6 domain-containing protein [Arcticibacter svalbardensis]EOR93936.1 putative Ni,Fe-hydrogenase I cytochrome b subunit [Arcticibacter svalbardensis MN12-7]
MAIIEPVHKDVENLPQYIKNSSPLRLWHWLSAIAISGSLITVLINSTLFEGPAMRATQAAKELSHELQERVWGVHIYFGYAVATLFLFRLILEAFQLRDQKFSISLKKLYQRFFVARQRTLLVRHGLTVKILYLVFYLLLTIMVVTGLSLAFHNELGIPKPLSHSIKEVHGFCMYLIIAFILVHIAGVVMAERKESNGIVSDMINGGKNS